MRKFVLPLLALYLDFIIADALLTLLVYFASVALPSLSPDGGAVWTRFGLAGAIALVLRMTGASIGRWLLEPAREERAAGGKQRQWPNLVLGTILVLSGLKMMVRWVEHGGVTPFFYMIGPSTAKIVVLMLSGLATVVVGLMLLRMAPFSRLASLVVILFNSAVVVFGILFTPDAVKAATGVILELRGRQFTPEDLEFGLTTGLYSASGFAVMCLGVLCVARELTRRAGGHSEGDFRHS